ncbi:MAG TPA: SDR family NAD(P)-dependent oxidoreductase [Chloroflexota bacterium]
MGAELARLLVERGDTPVLAYAGTRYERASVRTYQINPEQSYDFSRLLQETGDEAGIPWRGVVHLWSLDGPSAPDLTPSALAAAQVTGTGSTLRLVQALDRHRTNAARLWVVTRGTQPVGGQSGLLGLAQSPVWGLGRVIALEHPEMWGGLVDLDPDQPDDEAVALLEELWQPVGEDQLAFRARHRYVSRLIRGGIPASPPAPLSFHPDATYGIAGDLSDLSFQIARWMVARGARHLALPDAERTPEHAVRIGELEQLGVTVRPLNAGPRAIQPSLRGIIYLPGAALGETLREAAPDRFQADLQRAVVDSWTLHQMTHAVQAKMPLDFFVLFSSVTSLWGARGRGSDAAICHFLDALAHHWTGLGFATLSVNWGPWDLAGISSAADQRLLVRAGIGPLPPERAMAALGGLVATGVAQVAVARVDWSVLKPVYEVRGRRPFLELIEESRQLEVKQPSTGKTELVARLESAPVAERRTLLIALLQEELAVVLGLDRSRPPQTDQGFFDMGMDSLMAVELETRLRAKVGRRLPSTLAFDYPNVDVLAGYLLRDVLFLEEASVSGPAPTQRHELDEPIAVIGLGCRFPGGANSPEAFWRTLCDGLDAITEVPRSRWNVDDFYDPNPDAARKMNTRFGGFLNTAVDTFDAEFFGIAPREAASLDPQQRLLLEVTWEALEHAGQVPDKLTGSRTGVFVGINTNDYLQLISSDDSSSINGYVATGNTSSVAAGRLSYVLGLQGPSMAVDTACSSSLVAAHLACQSLRLGECNLALVGGVNLMLSPATTVSMAKLRALSPDGRCKTFDAAADGYGRGEGCGMIVLKRLTDAIADGDPIFALIRGSAVNHDGRSGGLTVPNGPAQQSLIRAALAAARVEPAEGGYVEAHGTGTPLGDPIEVQAVAAVLGQDRPSDLPVLLGSVKTNIGHLEAAAGVSSLIKVILALKHGEVPPHLHLKQPSKYIPWDEIPVVVPTERTPWPSGYARRIAGVSSFGFSGTNAHVVLEAPPLTEDAVDVSAVPKRAHLLALSAHGAEALHDLARAYRAWLAAEPPAGGAALDDVCYSAGVRRAHHADRLAVVGESAADLVERLDAYLTGTADPSVAVGRAGTDPRRIAFVFSGQGSQWIGMGRELLEREPVFLAAVEACDVAMRAYVEWSLLDVLAADEVRSRLDEIDVAQPALFAMQVAMAALWRSWGIEPDAVVGQSMGEVAAAHVAGALSLEDATRVICCRSQILKEKSGQGGMAAVQLSLDEARLILAGYEDRLSIAVSSSPTSTVIAGDPIALDDLGDKLRSQNVFFRRVKVDVASHSPQMEPLRDELLRALQSVQPRAASVPIYSTVTGLVGDGHNFDATYWVRNLREPVLFSDAVRQLRESGHSIFLEVGPRPILSAPIQQVLHHLGQEGAVLPQPRRDNLPDHRAALGALYTLGEPIEWSKVYPTGRYCAQLPTYAWQRKRFWIETASPNGAGASAKHPRSRRESGHHPLLGGHFKSARPMGEQFWEVDVETRSLPYLNDHQIQSVRLVPTSLYLEMALAAADEAFPSRAHSLGQVAVQAPLVLLDESSQSLQLVWTPEDRDTGSFQIFSKTDGIASGDNDEPGAATLLVSGKIVANPGAPVTLPESDWLRLARSRCLDEVPGEDFYRALEGTGVQIGGMFRGIEKLWRCQDEAVGEMRLPEALVAEADAYQIHPALLDATLRVLAAALPDDAPGGTFVPEAIASFCVYRRPGTRLYCHARLGESDLARFSGNVQLIDESGEVVAEALGVRFAPPDREVLRQAGQQRLRNNLYDIAWQPKAQGDSKHDARSENGRADERSTWIVFADRGGVGARLAALLQVRGQICHLVSPGATYERRSARRWTIDPSNPEHHRRLVQEVGEADRAPCRGVVHLWGLESAPAAETTVATLDADQVRGSGSALHLVQALATAAWQQPPRLWLISRGVQVVAPSSAPPAVAQAPLWGLGRVIALEHPELWGGLIDLDSSGGVEEVAALLAEIWAPDGEDQLAFRGGQRYVARLMRSDKLEPRIPPFQWRPDGTYLITGGLGALGLKITRWMVDRGARHVMLTGRRGLPERATWDTQEHDADTARKIAAIQDLERRGARISIVQADVTDWERMSGAIEPLGQTQPRLRGIVHAAGVLTPQAIDEIKLEDLQAVLHPKVAGTWVLHELTRHLDLDFLVLFSSAASVWGSAQAGHYVAANHFLDIFAHYRHAIGLPALSVNWGWWADGGMVSPKAEKYFAAIGLDVIKQDQGLDALGHLLDADVVQKTVAAVDWSLYKPVFEAKRRRPFLDLIQGESRQRSLVPTAEGLELMRRLDEVPPSERLEVVIAYVQAEVSRVLGLDSSQLLEPKQGFFQIGMDSLMAVDLKGRLEGGLGRSLQPTIAFEYPTIEALATYLAADVLSLELYGDGAGELPDTVPSTDGHWKNGHAELATLSEDELIALLAGELTPTDGGRST